MKQFRDTKYYVSPEGVVISRYPYGGHKGDSTNMERIVGTGKCGEYLVVKTRRKDSWMVHQMVMELYGPPCPGKGYVIDHIDENKLNNNIRNLQWLTSVENVSKSARIYQHSRKLTPEQADDIRQRYIPRKVTRESLAIEYGISIGTVKDILRNRYY